MCLSALSALPCCSLNDNEEVSLDDAVSSGLIVPFLSSYHSVSGARRLSHTSNQICTEGPSSHNRSGKISKAVQALFGSSDLMGLLVSVTYMCQHYKDKTSRSQKGPVMVHSSGKTYFVLNCS